jgi:hypothetical protein
MTQKIEHLAVGHQDPIEFKPGKFHPSLKLIPELSQESDEFLALAATVKKTGFIRPLLVDEEGRLVDDHSRSLWRVALRWQMKSVPVQLVKSADANLLIIHSLAHVRHLSKSAIAYLAEPQLQEHIRISLERYRKNLAKGQYFSTPPEAASDGGTNPPKLEQLAADLGFSKDTLDRAREVRSLFKAHPQKRDFIVEGGEQDGTVVSCTFQEWYEPKILRAFAGGEHESSRPLGLGAVIAAIQGNLATKDKGRIETRGQMELFDRSFIKASGNHYKYWHSMNSTSREYALAKLAAKAEAMKPEDRDGASEFYREVAKVYAGASRAGK